VSQPPVKRSELQPASELSSATEAVAQEQKPALHIQQASKETKITLNDLMKQLRYESGEATIKPEGYRVLDELVEYLRHAPVDQLIRVEGHADNMEIGPSLRSFFPTNWDLSKARATGVLRYLVEKGGIDSARISSVGYGDTKPVVSNSSEEGRQRNRRVDVVLYSPEASTEMAERVTRQAVAAGGDGFEIDSAKADARLSPIPAASSNDPTIGPPPSDAMSADSAGGSTAGNAAAGEAASDRPIVP
jgi:chemotaxis protein MotB